MKWWSNWLDFYSTYSLIFLSKKVFEGVQNHAWSCFEKTSLVFFLRNFWSRVERQVWSTFGEKSRPKLPFLNNLNHAREMFSKSKFGPDFSPNVDQTCIFEQFQCGPNLPFQHFFGPKYQTLCTYDPYLTLTKSV